MTMIERVARAMVAADSGPVGSILFDIHLAEFGDGYRKNARAAIVAMREPTECVLASVSASHGFRDASIYTPFIDAALKEGI
jgi:hypothetical protein